MWQGRQARRLSFCRVDLIADDDAFGIGLTTCSERSVWAQVLVNKGDWLPLVSPVDYHLASRAVGLMARLWQMTVLPNTLKNLAAFDAANKVGCVKMNT